MTPERQEELKKLVKAACKEILEMPKDQSFVSACVDYSLLIDYIMLNAPLYSELFFVCRKSLAKLNLALNIENLKCVLRAA